MFVIFRSQGWNGRKLHFHNGMEILLTLSEGDKMYINNAVYPIRRGSLFVLNSTDFHRSMGSNEKEPYQFYAIRFDPEEVCGVSTPNFDLTACFLDHRNFNHRCQLDADQLENLLRQINMLEYYLSPECSAYGKEIYSKIRLAEMLVYINALYESTGNAAQLQHSNKKSSDRISPVIQYIQEHYTEELSLDDLADVFSISKSHLCRIFKNITGSTLNAYVTNIRVLKAKGLLRAGYSVNFAGEMVGFKSASHFIRTFTKLEGVSPKRYSKLSASSTEFEWRPEEA